MVDGLLAGLDGLLGAAAEVVGVCVGLLDGFGVGEEAVDFDGVVDGLADFDAVAVALAVDDGAVDVAGLEPFDPPGVGVSELPGVGVAPGVAGWP